MRSTGTRRRWLCAAVSGLIATSVHSQSNSETFLAIARNDGLLVPIAIYDGREWWNRWPWAFDGNPAADLIGTLKIPQTLDAIPDNWLPPGIDVPREWTVQYHSGRVTTLRALRPVRTTHEALTVTVGIQTDVIPGPAPSGNDYAYDVGVAVAGPARLGTFVSASPAESQRVLRQLANRLRTLERDAIDRWLNAHEQLGPAITVTPVIDVERVSPPTLKKASRGSNGRTYYYLSAGKTYRRIALGDCPLNLPLAGVVVTEATGRVIAERLSATFYGHECGVPEGLIEPLATVEFNNRVLWITKINIEGSDYGLFDPDTSELLQLRDRWDLVH